MVAFVFAILEEIFYFLLMYKMFNNEQWIVR